jgi:transcriptional regulator with XRE-family HTH domain
MSTELNRLGADIRTIRKGQNLPHETSAKKAWFSRRLIAQVENGTRNGSYVTLSIIADAVDVPKFEITANVDIGNLPGFHSRSKSHRNEIPITTIFGRSFTGAREKGFRFIGRQGLEAERGERFSDFSTEFSLFSRNFHTHL